MNCINSKQLDFDNTRRFQPHRIRKAIKSGYKFHQSFWTQDHILRFFPKLKNTTLYEKYPVIKLEDLGESREFDEEFIATDPLDVTLTSKEYSKYIYDLKYGDEDELTVFGINNETHRNYKIVDITDLEIVRDYCKRIVLNNPVINGEYERLIFNIYPVEEAKDVIKLNETSYVKIHHMSDELKTKYAHDFFDFFKKHPKERHTITMNGNKVEVPRWQENYNNTPSKSKAAEEGKRSYMFDGENIDFPEYFKDIKDVVEEIDPRYNQSSANWYKENDNIAMHCDCENNMIEDYKIAIVSLYWYSDNSRMLKMSNIKTDEEFFIPLEHGTIVELCGNATKEFKHGTVDSKNESSSRISLSFRMMNDEIPPI